MVAKKIEHSYSLLLGCVAIKNFDHEAWRARANYSVTDWHGTFLQMKITPIKGQKQNTFTTRTSRGSISISRAMTPCHGDEICSDFKQALSTLKRLHQEAGGDQLEPVPYWKYKQWRSASSPPSSQERGCKQRFAIERGNPLFTELWRKPQTNGFPEFILFCYR